MFRIYPFVISILLLLCTLTPTSKNEFKKLSKEQRIDKAYELEFEKTRDLKTNTIPSERLVAAKSYADLMRQEKSMLDLVWQERGPDNVGGRTRALIYDLNDPSKNTVFAGSVGGGLWKTTNIDATRPNWKAVDDFWANIAISTIVQDTRNPNTIYVGTGEGWFNADAIRGNGIWKSTNGGDSFTQLQSTINDDFAYVNKIVITNNGTILATTRGKFTDNGGIFRSTNGGITWTRVLSSASIFSYGADIEVAADGTIYASMGMVYYGDGIYKSTNNGLTWEKIYESTADEKRIELACAPSNKNVVYALLSNSNEDEIPAIRKTTNAGATWNTLNTPLWTNRNCSSPEDDWTRGQSWYDLAAIVDPNDQNTIYVGAIDLFKSTNGGDSWSQISHWFGLSCAFSDNQVVHADQHIMAFKPDSSSELLFGNDGGVFQSTNANASVPAFRFKSNNYNVTQFYSVAVSNEKEGNTFLAGSQDNGSQYFTTSGINSTREVTGGDGAFCHIDQDNPEIQISSYIYNRYYITNDAWRSSPQYVSLGVEGRFINPTDYDSDANILYGAYEANSYSYIEDVGNSNVKGTRTNLDFDGKVSSVTVSPNTPNRVFFGINTKVVRVDDANSNLFSSTVIGRSSDFGYGYISCVAVKKGNDDHLLVTMSSYGVKSVWETKNGGLQWTNVEGNLPDMPVRWVEFVPNTSREAILGTELGVWYTDNLNGSSTIWKPVNGGLANVRVDMLQFREKDNFLVAATHGRGLFSTDGFKTANTGKPNLICDGLGTLTVNGNKVDISGLSIKNIGSASANSSHIGYYLSTNTYISTLDTYLGEDYISPLDPDESSTEIFSKTIIGLEEGTYYVGILVDYKDEISESNEGDNRYHYASPRLTISSETDKPNLRCDGLGTLRVDDNIVNISNLRIKNVGSERSRNSHIGYYLSTNNTITTGDIFIGEDYVESLEPNEVSVESFSKDVSGLSAGTYYVGIICDYLEVVEESNEEDNDCFYNSPRITINPNTDKVNLRCKSLGTLNYDNSNKKLNINGLQIINDGNTESSSSYIAYYLSTNSTISTSDIYLGEDFVSSLNSGETSTESFSKELTEIADGTYYVGILVDSNKEIQETNEEDNECYFSNTIVINSQSNNNCKCTIPNATNLCEDFQDYDEDAISSQSDCWTTWSGEEGGTEDSSIGENEGNKFLFVDGKNNGGGNEDIVLKLGDRKSGKYEYQFYLFAFPGDKAYYNILHLFSPGGNGDDEWAQEVYFDGDGKGHLEVNSEEYSFSYSTFEWVPIYQQFDISNNSTTLYIDGHKILTWTFSYKSNGEDGTRQLAANNFYPIDEEYVFFIDNITLEKVEEFHPNLIEQRSDLPLPNPLTHQKLEVDFDFEIFPNPTTGQFQLQLNAPFSQETIEVEIRDITGKLVQQHRLSDKHSTFDLSNQPNGIYYVRMKTEQEIVVKQVVLVK